MKSIEGLRDWARHYNATGCRDIRMFADAIETELAERYVALPIDADGEPIRVGDRIEYLTGGRDIVRFVTLNGDGWLVNERGWTPCTMRHHHPPTVEDVLEEMLREYDRDDTELTNGEIIERFAAKLQLREGE